jgi:hypothetical protein
MDGAGAAVVARLTGPARGRDPRPGLLYPRRLDRLIPVEVPESEGALSPFFSPTGSGSASFARGKPGQGPLSGGAPATILTRCLARRHLGNGRRDRVWRRRRRAPSWFPACLASARPRRRGRSRAGAVALLARALLRQCGPVRRSLAATTTSGIVEAVELATGKRTSSTREVRSALGSVRHVLFARETGRSTPCPSTRAG